MGLVGGLTSQQAVSLDLELESTVCNLVTCHPLLVFHKHRLYQFSNRKIPILELQSDQSSLELKPTLGHHKSQDGM